MRHQSSEEGGHPQSQDHHLRRLSIKPGESHCRSQASGGQEEAVSR